ncbi:MAG: hypothetical protein ACTHOD_11440 [Motilibacteraceae bacterium]
MDETLPAQLAVAAERVLHDLAVVGLRPGIVPDETGAVGELRAITRWPDGTCYGVWVDADEDIETRIARLGDQLQDAAVETLAGLGRPALWPECSDHPNRHPLQARCVAGRAVWCCPRSGRILARIGELAAPDARQGGIEASAVNPSRRWGQL